jgi:dihydrofolate reductase
MGQIKLIVARTTNGVIGNENKLLWDLPEDLDDFKRLTQGHVVVMGKNTWLSLPKKPLKDRVNIVLSSKTIVGADFTSWSYLNILSWYEQNHSDKDLFVIGGAKTYNTFLPFIKKAYVTEVYGEYSGDTVFDYDFKGWKKTVRELSKKSDNANFYKFTRN